MNSMHRMLTAGVRHQRAGRLDQAAASYRLALSADPANADGWHLLGLLVSGQGQHQAGIDCIARAIAEAPGCAAYYRSLGLALTRAGRINDALLAYCRAAELEPGEASTLVCVGGALLALGHLDAAAEVCRQALRLNPHLAEAWWQLANAYHLLGRLPEAAGAYREVLKREPSHAQAHYNLGVTQMREQRFAEAEQSYRAALRYKPDYFQAHSNLGNVLRALGRVPEAAEAYRAALRVNPSYQEARYNLGHTYQAEDRLEEALAAYSQVLRAKPDFPEAQNNFGNTLLALSRPREALEAYYRALEFDPGNAEARWNLGVAQLLLGNFQFGWEGYEWRFQQQGMEPRRFNRPRWDGSDLAGQRILLHAEQGLGDTIQFVRFLPEVRRRGGVVYLECQPALSRLLERLPGAECILPAGHPLPDFDCHAPLLSVPGILQSRLENIPRTVPYLSVPPAANDRWRKILDRESSLRPGRRIGLVWAGNPGHRNDRLRSLPLERLAALAGAPDTVLFSLQKGAAAEQARRPALPFPVVDLEAELHDFTDTAAAILHLDLVISVDTSVAHLAGALGRPVWVLLPFAPDWRWLLGRSDSPWYPTMRLFRQSRRGDWEGVADEVRKELLRLSGTVNSG